jgi:hypothetical protein
MKNSLRFSLLVLVVSGLLSACKLDVMVSSGGDVTSASGTRNCAGGNVCEFNVTDYTFNESFTAVARPGYAFSNWSAGEGFLCANSRQPTCNTNNTLLSNINEIIASDQIFYAVPIFNFVGIDTDGDGIKNHLDSDDDNDGVLDVGDNCPLEGPNADGSGCPVSDTLTVNGRTWYQPDLFQGITRSEIEAVCPTAAAGACVAGGVLNGKNMTGWTWATISAYNGLLSNYPGTTNYVCAEMQAGGFRPYQAVLPPAVGQGYVGQLQGNAPAPGPGYGPGGAAGLMVSWPFTPFCSNFVTTADYIANGPLGYTFIFSGWFYHD